MLTRVFNLGVWLGAVMMIGAITPAGAAEENLPAPDAGLPTPGVSAVVVKQGRITVVRSFQGSVPQLTDQTRKSWLLTGPLQAEMRRAGGAIVKVWAAAAPSEMGIPSLAVDRYALVTVDGKRPHLGVLMRDVQSRLWLETGEQLLEVTAAKALLKRLVTRVGCKVWLLGAVEENVLRAYRYDWLNCKQRTEDHSLKENKR